jgi:hypothetical protein
MSQPGEATAITLSLISHTNVGKTTLARTLLGRDIGEVADQPHVTDVSEAHTMIETAGGLRMTLWDTPGFGDTAQLLRRLRSSKTPIGWLLSQVWDRLRDRPLWCSQQAVRNVQSDADVVLYLVNATEDPSAVGYVAMEMQILEWIGKPVVVLLNQLGPPRGAALEQRDIARWEAALQRYPVVRATLGLDAFARCWVQELKLLETVRGCLAEPLRPALDALAEAWRERNLEVFRQSSRVLAGQISRAARDRAPVPGQSWGDKLRGAVAPLLGGETRRAREKAMTALATRLDRAIVESTNQLIALHRLEGEAAAEILARLRENFTVDAPLDAPSAALLGAIVSGALSGLAADLAAGGLTFGGGAVAGGLLGAFGAAGLAKGYNLVRGAGQPAVRWSPDFLRDLVKSALLRYLAVAHFGRGRGRWQESEAPRYWQDEVARVVDAASPRVDQAIRQDDAAAGQDEAMLARLMEDLASTILLRLYPGAAGVFRAPRSAAGRDSP